MKDEIRAAIRKMKLGKATSPDSISVKLLELEALQDYGIDRITTLLNEIYDSGQISPDIFISIFIALQKKPEARDCELHKLITIRLMSHITKILLESA